MKLRINFSRDIASEYQHMLWWRRSTKIAIFLLLLCVFGFRKLFDDQQPSPLGGTLLMLESAEIKDIPQKSPPPVAVFYHVFLKDENDQDRVKRLIDEQLSFLDPAFHKTPVMVTSIGHPLKNMSQLATIREHQTQGSEGNTLRAIWEYCKRNPIRESKVVYIHSKGSFHDRYENTLLRHFLTKGALSEECANMPQSCDVCSSHMSPLPHPHTPGNMWVARCDYVARLIDPFAAQEGQLPSKFGTTNGCRGFGRYFFEHWVHSRPDVKPCDLYPHKDFAWGYGNIPKDDFVNDLRMAPRWDFEVYNIENCDQDPEKYLGNTFESYQLIYKSIPGSQWYLWDFFNHSWARQAKPGTNGNGPVGF